MNLFEPSWEGTLQPHRNVQITFTLSAMRSGHELCLCIQWNSSPNMITQFVRVGFLIRLKSDIYELVSSFFRDYRSVYLYCYATLPEEGCITHCTPYVCFSVRHSVCLSRAPL